MRVLLICPQTVKQYFICGRIYALRKSFLVGIGRLQLILLSKFSRELHFLIIISTCAVHDSVLKWSGMAFHILDPEY